MKILGIILLLYTTQIDTSNRVVEGVEIVEGAYDNFKSGYSDGWTEGYCYEQTTINCNVPYPPAPPPMRPQDKDTYKSGYSRGFVDGRKAYKNR